MQRFDRKTCGASEWVSDAGQRANGGANGPLLYSLISYSLTHHAMISQKWLSKVSKITGVFLNSDWYRVIKKKSFWETWAPGELLFIALSLKGFKIIVYGGIVYFPIFAWKKNHINVLYHRILKNMHYLAVELKAFEVWFGNFSTKKLKKIFFGTIHDLIMASWIQL